MELSDKTARQIWAEVKANPNRARFGFGEKAALVNIDVQKAYTCVGEFKTAYETDPRQIEYINTLARAFRTLKWPVVWTHVAYMASGEDAGVWGTRTNTPDSLQNIKFNSRRAEFDDRTEVNHKSDVTYCKKMASAFFETPLQSLLVWHRVDIRGSISLSTALCVHHPEIIEMCRERDWEFFTHGIYNTRYTYGMSEEQERAMIIESIETIEQHTGRKPAGYRRR